MERRISTHALIGLLVASTIVGCADKKEPTASQAGIALKKHVTHLLEDIVAQKIQITKDTIEPSGCKNATGRYLYSVAATKTVSGPDDPDILVSIMITSAEGAAQREGKYKIFDTHSSEPHYAKLRDEQTHTNLTVQSLQKGRVEVVGTTDCLKLH